MLRAFARLVADIFPSLDPTNARAFLNAVWKHDPPWLDLYATQIPPKPCQGDILYPITFVVQDDSGAFGELVAPGMILSHSCDIEEDENIIFAACKPFHLFSRHRSVGEIKNNTFFNFFYLEGVPSLGNRVVDFGIVQSVRRLVLEREIAQGTIRRASSFTTLGYYFLIAKMTVRFLRPQPSDEVRNLAQPRFRERLSAVLRGMVSLVRYLFRG